MTLASRTADARHLRVAPDGMLAGVVPVSLAISGPSNLAVPDTSRHHRPLTSRFGFDRWQVGDAKRSLSNLRHLQVRSARGCEALPACREAMVRSAVIRITSRRVTCT
jgi:hypothetical protein